MVPTEEEIEWAVKRLRNHRSREASWIWAKKLKRWLEDARKAEKYATMAGMETMENKGTTAFKTLTESTEADNWEMVVDLIQTSFREGKLAEEATWQAGVLIPKVKKDYQGLALWR